jgi:transposase-like protein
VGKGSKPEKEAHMKTQLSKPARSKARYSEKYKQEALELWRASGRSAAKVAAELGMFESKLNQITPYARRMHPLSW